MPLLWLGLALLVLGALLSFFADRRPAIGTAAWFFGVGGLLVLVVWLVLLLVD